MTQDRVLHARSGAVLHDAGPGPAPYVLTSLRSEHPRRFADLAQAEQAFEAEAEASEQDPAVAARLGGA